MDTIKRLTPFLSVAPQISLGDVGTLSAHGYRAIISNRPDGEGEGQPTGAEIAAAAKYSGLDFRHVPVVSGKIRDEDVAAFTAAMAELQGPVLAFCRTGTRSTSLWALSEAHHLDPAAILRTAQSIGYDLSALEDRLQARWQDGLRRGARLDSTAPSRLASVHQTPYDVLIVGGGAAGCAAAASLLKRRPSLSIAIVEPRDIHYYQPGWTLVGGGVFDRARTERPMSRAIPKGVKWIRAAVAAFEPENNAVVLEDGARIPYRTLVAAPGLTLRWNAIHGLSETLGKNGVTSNYLFDLAPYTWQLVQGLRGGTAIFSQPPMPIKCAGAPQKAMYLSCDHWRRQGVLGDINVEFRSAAAVLFGVADFVPPLMKYVERYGAKLNFNNNLVAVDGPARKAWFEVKKADNSVEQIECGFDMIHVVPPQSAPDFIRQSPLADPAGWIEVDHETLRHKRYGNVFGLGDGCSAPNAKTAAAVRKQAPVVAENVLAVLDGRGPRALYDGYGSCPLTVERGKVVLAEFGYGGKLLPTFPLDPRVPRRMAWKLKAEWMPNIYWDMMLRGREWLAEPKMLPHEPLAHEATTACNFDAKPK
ncbi:MAG TPA: TIGR01244 family sulfur transferase [Dongiaceae bacterium]|nr:TIGR01244 family sulfur transferase [Dongiaceae bacterium]